MQLLIKIKVTMLLLSIKIKENMLLLSNKIKETMLLLSIKIILLSIDKRDHATINEGHDYSIYFIKTNELISKLRDNAALDS